MLGHRRWGRDTLLLLIAATLLSSSTASAQDGEAGTDIGSYDDPFAGVEEMIVVGTGGFVIQDETVSVIGFDSEALSADRIQDARGLAEFTPNLEIKSAFAASNPVFFIRGIGLDDLNANSSGAVAIYQDGVYMNSPTGQLFQYFDVEGVKILRGPQASGYRNASAGAILTQSKRPAREFEAYAKFTAGNYELYEFEGALNLPINDYVATRFSGKYEIRDGYTRNRCFGQPLSNVGCQPLFSPAGGAFDVAVGFRSLGDPRKINRRANDAHNWAGRFQILFDVPLRDTEMEWLFNVHGGQNLSQASQFQHRGFTTRPPINQTKQYRPDQAGYQDQDGGRGRSGSFWAQDPGDPWAGDYNNGGDEEVDLMGVVLNGLWVLSDTHTVRSVTGYEWNKRHTIENTDANPLNNLTTLYRSEAWQVSQDLRFESAWTEDFETMIGAYYLQEDLSVDNAYDVTLVIQTQTFRQNTRSFALFGELAWTLFNDFTLDGSIRYTSEYKELDNFATASNPTRGSTGITANAGDADDVFRGVSGMVGLTYHIAALPPDVVDARVYAKFTRGWKPGHFNGGARFSRQLVEPVEPENVKAVEGGFKTEWFDGLIKFDTALFYYDFENMQVFLLEADGLDTPVSQLINAKGAEIWGWEADLKAEPVKGLRIVFNVGYLDTEYTEFTNQLVKQFPRLEDMPIRDPEIQEISYTGNRMIASPEWAFSGSVAYEIELGRLGSVTPRFSFSWKDDVFFDLAEGGGSRDDLPKGTIAETAYWLYHTSLSWKSLDEVLTVTAWVDNITKQKYRITSFDASGERNGFVVDVYGPPRTFGVTVTAKF